MASESYDVAQVNWLKSQEYEGALLDLAITLFTLLDADRQEHSRVLTPKGLFEVTTRRGMKIDGDVAAMVCVEYMEFLASRFETKWKATKDEQQPTADAESSGTTAASENDKRDELREHPTGVVQSKWEETP